MGSAKLDTIKNMPTLKDAKEIRQFLGLTGYYRKFVPRFADISRPLTQLTNKEMKFMWTPECQKSFELLKSFLCGEAILKYADTSKPYTLYTDASKYGWPGVLTQSHTTVIDGKSVTTDHPVVFVSGLFRGFHRFLKACIAKHINHGLEWDELTPIATACYNFFPNCSARESAFCFMFWRDPINKLNMMLHAARRYFHDDNGLPNLEAL